jgi:hypothetical protein
MVISLGNCPWRILIPAQHTEHFGLNCRNLIVREPRIRDPMNRSALHVFQYQDISAIGVPVDILETVTLSPHEQQSNNVPEVQAIRIGRVLQAIETAE